MPINDYTEKVLGIQGVEIKKKRKQSFRLNCQGRNADVRIAAEKQIECMITGTRQSRICLHSGKM